MVFFPSLTSFVASTRLILPEVLAIDSPDQFLHGFVDILSSKNAHFWYFQGFLKNFCLLQALPKKTGSNYTEEICHLFFDTAFAFFRDP